MIKVCVATVVLPPTAFVVVVGPAVAVEGAKVVGPPRVPPPTTPAAGRLPTDMRTATLVAAEIALASFFAGGSFIVTRPTDSETAVVPYGICMASVGAAATEPEEVWTGTGVAAVAGVKALV